MKNGLGDIPSTDPFVDPFETYARIQQSGVWLPRRKWLKKPDWQVPAIPGAEVAQRLVEEHGIPRMWELLADFWMKLQTGIYFIKRPNWIEPPVTAVNIDIVSEDPVLLGAASGDVVIATFTVPDRFVGSILRIGHELDIASQFGTILWTIQINKSPVINYQKFKRQRGNIINPTEVPIFPPLKTGDVVEFIGNNPGAVAVNAFARMWGFMFPTRILAQDGSFRQYQTI